jgi:S1-C subfamily serine protease
VTELISKLQVGDEITLTLLRDGEEIKLPLTVGAKP